MRRHRRKGRAPKEPFLLRHRYVILLALLALSFRLPGIQWGLPSNEQRYSFHPDEVDTAGRAAIMVATAGANPHFFRYPSLFIYMVAGPLWAVGGEPSLYVAHLVARLIAAMFGVGLAIVTYAFGVRAFGEQLGMIAGMFAACAPLLVMHSHFATVDVPSAFWSMLSLYCALLAWQQRALRPLLLAGLFAGLSGATKYTGLASLLPVLAVPLFLNLPPRQAVRRCLACIGIAGVAFLAACPFALADWATFRRDLAAELLHGKVGGTLAFVNTPPTLVYHFLRSLPLGMGPVLELLFVAGLVAALWRRRPADLLLVGWVGLQVIMLSLTREKFIRYTIPLVPAAVLLAAGLLAIPARRAGKGAPAPTGRWRRLSLSAAWLLTGLAVLYCLGASSEYLRSMLGQDPRARVGLLVQERLLTKPAGAVGLAHLPWYYSALVCPVNGGVRTGAEFTEWQASAPYRVLVYDIDRTSSPGLLDSELRSQPPDYFVLTDLEIKEQLRLGDERARVLRDFLKKGYRVLERSERKPRLLGIRLYGEHPPPDWEYTAPTVWLYERVGP